MKNYRKLIFLLLVTNLSFSQVGIGTTNPDTSSSLDISSANSGLLIPRVSLTNVSDSTSPINSPASSLLVFNTNTTVIGGNGEGYYYWNGTQWTKLQTSIDDKWTRNSSFGSIFPSTLTDRVGIGTNNPLADLHLKSFSSNPAIFDGDNNLYISFAENGSFRGFFGSYSGNPEDIEFGTYSGNLGAVHLSTNNDPKLTVINNGNIGIGNTNPSYLLDISNRMRLRSGGNIFNSAGIWLNNSLNTAETSFLGMDSNDNIGFFGNTGAGWGLVMNNNNGNVGIGNQNPNAPLQFSNSVVNRKIVLYDTNNNNNQYYGFGINGGMLRYQTDAIGADHTFFAGVNATTSNELMRIKGTGNVGIGTTNPTEKLEVNGKIKITDGTQAADKVLTSDANGVGSWQPIGINNISATLSAGVNVHYTTANFLQTGTSITLPTGRYAVNVTMLLTNTTATFTASNSSFWLRTSFSDSNGVNPLSSSDIQGSTLISGNLTSSSLYSILNGTVVINNNSGGPKTYYYVAGRVQPYNTTDTLLLIGGNLGENNIIAYKLQ